ncbi:hypothetical protein [Streptomyces sp. NPDC057702]|uniref:hypothetical protein n=1 Tax=unclassified Streptomyces TaxID=2593676 RepID=UPI0036881C17
MVMALAGSVVSMARPATAAPASEPRTATTRTAALSSAAGPITRSEVLERARYWYDRRSNIPYNQGATYKDSSGRAYRTDCSGYVSMAWHMSYSADTRALADAETRPISRGDLRPGDILNSYYDHVILFEKWDNDAHTLFSYYSFGSTPVKHATGVSINAATLDSHPNSDYRALRYKKIVEDSPPDPTTLPSGTLVKTANNPTVKVIVGGAGLPVAGSDVGPGGYDLSKVVPVDSAAFNALPSAPASGTVVHDQAGGPSRYVVVDGAALPITGAEWTADGYDQRPDMGVPSSWLAGATGNTLSTGLIVMNQSGRDPSRYVMVSGAALPISGDEWTANGYDKQMLLGVPGNWLRTAAAKSPPNGTVLMDQVGTDSSRYVMVNGSALPISWPEWTSQGYDRQTLMGVPGTWLRAQVARPLANKTVVKEISGANPTVYVMAGGSAVPLSAADYTGLGYDKRPLERVPGTWLGVAAGRGAPNVGTLLLAPESPTVWLVVEGGRKKGLTADDFGPGKYSLDDVVKVPNALVATLPTA